MQVHLAQVARSCRTGTDYDLLGLVQMLNMRQDDVGKSFLDQFAALNCVGISERVEQFESWSVPSSGERVSIMLDCMVDSAGQQLLIADCESAAVWIITQNTSSSSGRRARMWVLPHNVVCVTLELRRRSSDTVLSKFA